MKTEYPLVNKEYLLEKFQGKGGWTYARIPEILQDKHSPFGWVRVRGTIDDYEIKNYHLMPMGNGSLFLPLKAAIRKKIKKEAGDSVRVTLYADNLPTGIPDELKLCLQNEPHVFESFLTYSENEQKRMVDWIYSAKTDAVKIDRINQSIDKIMVGIKNKPA